jgi:transcription antitermination factor NusG
LWLTSRIKVLDAVRSEFITTLISKSDFSFFMSNDEDIIKDIIAQLQSLQLQQAALIQRLERVSGSQDNGIPTRTTTVQVTRELAVGDRVRINNPGPFQATRGTITKIGNSRITVQARNGTKISRAPKNLTLEDE